MSEIQSYFRELSRTSSQLQTAAACVTNAVTTIFTLNIIWEQTIGLHNQRISGQNIKNLQGLCGVMLWAGVC